MNFALFFLVFWIWQFICISVFCQLENKAPWPGVFRRKQKPFPIDGSWSEWGEWTECFDNTHGAESFFPEWEDFTIKRRKRECNSPAPLYGGEDCSPPKYKYKQCSCDNPLGLSTLRIKDKQITSLDYVDGHHPTQSRIGTNFTGWCPKENLDYFQRTYIQVDFKNFVKVKKIATIGIDKGRISRYELKYSIDGNKWTNIYKSSDESEKIFKGNILPQQLRVNEFSSSKLLKHLRLYPIEAFGAPCLKMEIYGCISTCGETLLSSFGEISAYSTPSFEQNCLWKIEVLNTTSLTFDLTSFYVPCSDGYLDFRVGDNFESSKLFRRICLQDDDTEFSSLELSQNSVWLNFISNSSSPEIGFHINYFSECSKTINLIEDIPVIVTSPNYPNDYFNNLDCTWNIISPVTNKKIDVTVNSFDIESSDSNCLNDYVMITSNETSNSIFNKKYCSSNPLKKTFSIKNKFSIQFKSDDFATEPGFSFTFLSGKKKPDAKMPTTAAGSKVINNVNHSNNMITPKQNNSDSLLKKKVKKDTDDTWTVIIISAFSAFCVILLLAIVGANLKRFLENRNDVNAQCAKALEEQKQKKKMKLSELNRKRLAEVKKYEMQQMKNIGKESKDDSNEVMLTGDKNETTVNEASDLLPNNKEEEENELNNIAVTYKSPSTDSFAIDKLRNTDSPDVIETHYSDEQVDEVEKDCVDTNSYDSSTPQIHSPLRSDLYLHDNESENVHV